MFGVHGTRLNPGMPKPGPGDSGPAQSLNLLRDALAMLAAAAWCRRAAERDSPLRRATSTSSRNAVSWGCLLCFGHRAEPHPGTQLLHGGPVTAEKAVEWTVVTIGHFDWFEWTAGRRENLHVVWARPSALAARARPSP